MVDAPLGRTPKEAEEGTLDAMVGCDDAIFESVKPVIVMLGRQDYTASAPWAADTK